MAADEEYTLRAPTNEFTLRPPQAPTQPQFTLRPPQSLPTAQPTPPPQPPPLPPDSPRYKAEIEKEKEDFGQSKGTGYWLLDAILGPDTVLGNALHGRPARERSIEERDAPAGVMRTLAGSVGQSPLIDLSTGMDKGAPSGIAKAVSSFTSPSQLPLMLAPGSRAVSALFSGATIPQFMAHYESYQRSKKAGDEAGMQEAQGAMGADIVMGSLAAYHAGNVGESTPVYKPSDFLTKDELSYATGLLQQHIEQSATNGDHAGVHEGMEGLGSLLARVASEKPDRRVTMAELPQGQVERRSLEHTPEGQKVVYESMLLETIKQDDLALAQTDISDKDKVRIAEHRADFQAMLDDSRSGKYEPATQQTPADIPSREGLANRGSVPPSSATPNNPPETPQLGEKAIRSDQPATGGERSPSTAAIAGSGETGDGGQGTEGALSDKVSQLTALVPSFQSELTGEKGEAATGANGVAETSSPVSQPVIPDSPNIPLTTEDRELSNGGITIVKGGEDIGLVARYLGSLSQAARRLNNPILNLAVDRILDTTIGIARDTRDTLQGFRKEVRSNITKLDWDKTVDLLNDPSINPSNLPPNTPNSIKNAYLYTRELLDNHRVQARDAKRLELIAGGMTKNKAESLVPDDWGIKEGYYVHAFPGNWTITEHVGVDPKGNPIYEPIPTGWRKTALSEAQKAATEYLSANPNSSLRVELDNISLPGRGIIDRERLRDLHDEIKSSSTLIYNGANPDGVMANLLKESGAAAFGPRRPSPKMFGATLERESNLPGWVRDLDNFERYIIGMERYIKLAPARAEILKYRNALAQGSGMAEVLKPGEFPKRYSGDYANALGRLDASIEALEGYPTGLETSIRNSLQKRGWDPNLVNNIQSKINSMEALMKLGFSPASAGLHLAQTIAATYPVLGERWTAYGIAHAYSSKYDALVHDLGIEATSNLLDVDSYRSYREGYGRSITEAQSIGEGIGGLAKTAFQDLQTTGLFMFSKGVETARRVAAIGAYEKALHEGLTPQKASKSARDTLIRTQFMYAPADTPIALRMLPRPMTQFKNFALKMGEFVTGLRGAEIPRFIAAMGIIGYAGLPMLGVFSNLIKGVFGYDPENEFKRAFPRFSRGALGYAGVDYTKNIGFADWLGPRSFEPSNLIGPAGSDITNIIKLAAGEIKGPSRGGQQDIDTAKRNLSPEARRLWDESIRMATSPSLTDPRTGSTIISHLSPRERIEMALGLTPLRVASERESHEYIRNQIEQYKDKRGYFVDRLAETQLELASPNTTPAEKAEILKQVISLSHLANEYGVGSNLPKAVIERAKEMQMERLLRDVKKAPKIQRIPAYQEMQRFKSNE